jgi:hypothetical protein
MSDFCRTNLYRARLTERPAMFELQSRDPGSKNSKEDEFQEKFEFLEIFRYGCKWV